MQIVCNHFEERSSRMEPEVPRFFDKIIKSADVQTRVDVRSHNFPDFTAGHTVRGELVSKKTSSFQPQFFDTNPTSASATNLEAGQQDSQAGARDGLSAAEEKKASIRQLLHQVQQAILSMESVAREVDREMERTVGLLALGLAEIMVNHTAEGTPDILLGNLSRALQKGQGQEIRKIRLHPADMDPADASRKRLSNLVENIEDIRLETDVTLSRGGCVVETDCGIIDATSGNQLKVLADAFQSILHSVPR